MTFLMIQVRCQKLLMALLSDVWPGVDFAPRSFRNQVTFQKPQQNVVPRAEYIRQEGEYQRIDNSVSDLDHKMEQMFEKQVESIQKLAGHYEAHRKENKRQMIFITLSGGFLILTLIFLVIYLHTALKK